MTMTKLVTSYIKNRNKQQSDDTNLSLKMVFFFLLPFVTCSGITEFIDNSCQHSAEMLAISNVLYDIFLEEKTRSGTGVRQQ